MSAVLRLVLLLVLLMWLVLVRRGLLPVLLLLLLRCLRLGGVSLEPWGTATAAPIVAPGRAALFLPGPGLQGPSVQERVMVGFAPFLRTF